MGYVCYVVCDGCGKESDVETNPSLSGRVSGMEWDTEDYGDVVDGETRSGEFGDGWVEIGRRDPDDHVAIQFDYFCPDCR